MLDISVFLLHAKKQSMHKMSQSWNNLTPHWIFERPRYLPQRLRGNTFVGGVNSEHHIPSKLLGPARREEGNTTRLRFWSQFLGRIPVAMALGNCHLIL